MLDNEAPKAYSEAIESYGIEWELVPPHNHRRNVAEKGIQTAKGHIIANLLGCDDTFPLREWHRLLPQIELTLNMLRASNVVPTVSAHLYFYGVHDYNRIPLAPLGCATQCFTGMEQRSSFGSHSCDSWYIGMSNKHYRCYKVFVQDTKEEGTTDTINFHHKRVTNPKVSAADAITVAANNLTETIQTNMQKDLTTLNMKELERLAQIFQEAATKVSEQNARQKICLPIIQSFWVGRLGGRRPHLPGRSRRWRARAAGRSSVALATFVFYHGGTALMDGGDSRVIGWLDEVISRRVVELLMRRF
jgi:hypothetical protein